MDVSIIIVNYNTKKLLKECIESIYAKTSDISFEIIVVDNASVDDSGAMLRSNFPDVLLIESSENLGFGKANNLGSKMAKGKHLFLLNSDTLFINNPKILSDFLTDNPEVAICGGNLFDANLQPATSFSRMNPGLFADIDYFCYGMFSRLRYGKSLNFNYTNKTSKINGFISGADIMIRKDIFIDINGFDPDFFMYYEETEMAFRVRKRNFKIFSVPQAKIIHLEGASETVKEKSAIRSYKSKFIYYKKVGKEQYINVSHFLFKITALQRITCFTLIGSKSKALYWRNLMKWENETFKSKS